MSDGKKQNPLTWQVQFQAACQLNKCFEVLDPSFQGNLPAKESNNLNASDRNKKKQI